MKVSLDFTTIILMIFGLLISIIAFFLTNVYKDFKENKKQHEEFRQKAIEEIGKLKGHIELAQQEQRMKHEQIEQRTQLEIKNLAENVNRLTNTVEKLITIKEES